MEERAELLRRVRRVRLATQIRVRGTITGQHRSIFGGSGLELTDLREYQPGDDLRAIDWKVTARYARPYVREFAEDRVLVAEEPVTVHSRRIGERFLGGLEHVLEVLPHRAGLSHSGTASWRMRSRRPGLMDRFSTRSTRRPSRSDSSS